MVVLCVTGDRPLGSPVVQSTVIGRITVPVTDRPYGICLIVVSVPCGLESFWSYGTTVQYYT